MLNKLPSRLRRAHLRLEYPGIEVDDDTSIGFGCEIRCVLGARIILKRCTIMPGVVLRSLYDATIEISDSHLGPRCVIIATKRITIHGAHLGAQVIVRDHDHAFGDGKRLATSGFVSAPIQLDANSSIGDRSTVLKGVHVHPNSEVLPRSVVTRDIFANSTVGGVPAIPITGPQ